MQFYERIRVDGVMISDDDLTRLCERVTVACESLTLPEGETIGEFELRPHWHSFVLLSRNAILWFSKPVWAPL